MPKMWLRLALCAIGVYCVFLVYCVDWDDDSRPDDETVVIILGDNDAEAE